MLVLWHAHALITPVLMGVCDFCVSGETQVQAEVLIDSSEMNPSVGVLASVHVPQVSYTADSWQTTVLLYNSKDNQTSNATDIITLRLTGIPKHTGQ